MYISGIGSCTIKTQTPFSTSCHYVYRSSYARSKFSCKVSSKAHQVTANKLHPETLLDNVECNILTRIYNPGYAVYIKYYLWFYNSRKKHLKSEEEKMCGEVDRKFMTDENSGDEDS